MTIDDRDFWDLAEPDETTYMVGRQLDRTYLSRTFRLKRPGSADDGQPARFVYKVYEELIDGDIHVEVDGHAWDIRRSPGGRVQIKLLVARDAKHVKDLWIQKLKQSKDGLECVTVLALSGREAESLVETLRNLDYVPIQGDEYTTRIDDALVRQVFSDPTALISAYDADPDAIRQVIEGNVNAKDVVATANRRVAVDHFRRLLEDQGFFDAEKQRLGVAGSEAVWQTFFEENSWILGVGLTGQLLTSWSDEKLEQVVTGRSISGVGKRADALLRTAGIVSSMVFAEFKHHRAPLLGREYRPGCWSASEELAGGIAQCQGTVHLATQQIGDRIYARDSDGGEIPNDVTYLVQPRSFLVIGSLAELRGHAGGDNPDKVRSFQLLRRNTHAPEIITFDELLARAEWLTQSSNDPEADETEEAGGAK
ncbi:MAG: DUF4263 domain-containing protein [Micrococcales bacterium]|nr:DUF4263 domain-containing protein [Micrococcales bacterium]